MQTFGTFSMRSGLMDPFVAAKQSSMQPETPLHVKDMRTDVYEFLASSPLEKPGIVTYYAVGNFKPFSEDGPSREDQLDEAFNFVAEGVETKTTRLSTEQLKGLGKLPITKKVYLKDGHPLYMVDLVSAVLERPTVKEHLTNAVNVGRLQARAALASL